MKTNTAQQLIHQDDSGEYRLLLDRLHKAPLNETGRGFVLQAINGLKQLARIDADAMLQIAVIAQQHGLIKQSLTLFAQINSRFPDCIEGWQQHLEILNLLANRPALVQVCAMAAEHVPAATMRDWKQSGLAAGTGFQKKSDSAAATDVTAPFRELRSEENQIELFMNIFRGRDDAFARQWVNRNEDKQGYVPVYRPLQSADIQAHLAGHRTYGIYLLDHDSRVHTGVIDIDLVRKLRSPEQTRKHSAAIRRESLYLLKRIATLAGEAGLSSLTEVSGGKGYHIWFPVQEPVPAAVMRQVIKQLIGRIDEDVHCFSLEVFPKQDKLTGKGLGNLVKLPLGIHRGSGKPSSFVMAADRNRASQFDLLARLKPTEADVLFRMADEQKHNSGRVLLHPRHAARAKKYPEIVRLEERCAMLGQLMATLRSSKELSIREEKIVLSTLGHLPRARLLLHYLFEKLPEYNRPLLDYKISKIRGSVLGCKRIHSLLEQGSDLPCSFTGKGYPHPLRHIKDFGEEVEPKSEKIENLKDALICLKTAIIQVERFMG